MTYQSASEHFAARIPGAGQSIASAPFLTARRALATMGGMFASIGTALVNAGEASARTQQIEALQAKSDEELARLGIKRDEIVYHVFKEFMFL